MTYHRDQQVCGVWEAFRCPLQQYINTHRGERRETSWEHLGIFKVLFPKSVHLAILAKRWKSPRRTDLRLKWIGAWSTPCFNVLDKTTEKHIYTITSEVQTEPEMHGWMRKGNGWSSASLMAVSTVCFVHIKRHFVIHEMVIVTVSLIHASPSFL